MCHWTEFMRRLLMYVIIFQRGNVDFWKYAGTDA